MDMLCLAQRALYGIRRQDMYIGFDTQHTDNPVDPGLKIKAIGYEGYNN